MGFLTFDLVLRGIVFFIYGTTCLIGIIFSFSLKFYKDVVKDKLNLEVFNPPSYSIVAFLERDIDWFDAWLERHNTIAGFFIVALSLLDIRLFLKIIDRLSLL